MQKQKALKISTQAILTVSMSVMSGCGLFSGKDSYFRDYSVDYVKAKETKPLNMPSHLDAYSARSIMPVPAATSNDSKILQPNAIPAPTNASMQSGAYNYQITSTPEGSVIESDADKTLLWVRLQAYLVTEHINIEEKNEGKGFIETDWFAPEGQKEYGFVYRSYAKLFDKEQNEKQELKLRFNLKPSSNSGHWIVTVKAKQRPTNSTKQVPWSMNTHSILLTGIKQDFLIYLVEHSGDQVVKGSAGKFDPKTMTSMIKDGNGNPVLKFTSSFDTAWNQINKVLLKENVTVKQANYAAGIYYIAVPGIEEVKPEDSTSPNFFATLFGSRKAKLDSHTPIYRLILAPVNDGIYVTLEKDIDTVAPEKLSEIILKHIQEGLQKPS